MRVNAEEHNNKTEHSSCLESASLDPISMRPNMKGVKIKGLITSYFCDISCPNDDCFMLHES